MNSWKPLIAGIFAIGGGIALLMKSDGNDVIAGILIAAGLGLFGAQGYSNKPRNKEKL